MTATADRPDPFPSTTSAVPVPWDELLAQRAFLVRFARRKLHDPTLAEDLVHDVFEAVASGRAAFGGRSALRTWLAGILKHKIVDLVRQRARRENLSEDLDSAACQALECPLPPPDQLAEQRETLRQVLQGVACLPRGLREAMELRILQEQPSAQVCQTLAITENNLLQRLFKARRCLSQRLSMAVH